MKHLTKGLLSLAVAAAFLFSFNFNSVYALEKSCVIYTGITTKTCKSAYVYANSSGHWINVRATSFTNNNIKVQVIDYNNGAVVYTSTLSSDGSSFNVTLNNVYSRYYLKLTCDEWWLYDDQCQGIAYLKN